MADVRLTTLFKSAPKPAAAGPHRYRLKFIDDAGGADTVLEFVAFDAYQALVRAKQHSGSRASELWRNGRKICSLQLLPHGVWEVLPPGE